MIRHLVLALPFAVLASQATAEQETYVCELETKRGEPFGAEMVFAFDPGSGRMIVADPFIMYHYEAPTQAAVTEFTEKKQVFKWEVPLSATSGEGTIVKYRAAFFKSSLKINLNARPAGYRNNWTARGTCQVSEQQLQGVG